MIMDESKTFKSINMMNCTISNPEPTVQISVHCMDFDVAYQTSLN